MPARSPHRWLAGGMLLALVASACGSRFADDEPPTSSTCPADEGCVVEFVSATVDGEQLTLTWTANFVPNANRNHLHIYWDTFTPAQVSDDASDRNVAQGLWTESASPTGFTTGGATAPAARGDATRLCAVAADRDHRVIDEGDQRCIDVTAALAEVG
ncbi:MAG: hypothetical protein HKN26_09545 [Acidimicrobiales bacterium]|nr:hypothetical protein [Acidimicrobiales bacterium]